MKLTILILFLIAVAFFLMGRWTDNHSTESASVSSSIVPYVVGAIVLSWDLLLLLGYALWRLFAA